MPRTSYKAVFIHEIDKLLTLAYTFELLFDNETDLILFELVEYCDQIYPMIRGRKVEVNKYVHYDMIYYTIQVGLTLLRGFPFIQILLCQSPSGLIVHLRGFYMRPLVISELIEDSLFVSGNQPDRSTSAARAAFLMRPDPFFNCAWLSGSSIH